MPGKARQATTEDFQLLGLPYGAPSDKVKKAYKAFVKTWHPDRFPLGSRQQRHAEERLKDANAAYRRIRHDWEAGILARHPGPASPAAQPEQPRQSSAAGRTASRFPDLRGPWHQIQGQILRFFRAAQARRRWLALLLLLPLLILLIELEPTSPPIDHREVFPNRSSDPGLPVTPTPIPPTGPEATAPPEPPGKIPQPATLPSHTPPPAPDEDLRTQQKTFFSLGSTKAEVQRVQGKPAKVFGQTWVYGLSDVTFREGRVWRYHNFDGGLKVRMLPSRPMGASQTTDSFTLGATRDEVLLVQGTPTQVEGSKWSYGFSEVHFKDGVVVGFNNFFDNLRVAMQPAPGFQAAHGKGYFTIGSSRDEVLALQGTPTIVQGNLWSYQLSDVLFVDGKVRSVNDFSGILNFAEPDALAEK